LFLQKTLAPRDTATTGAIFTARRAQHANHNWRQDNAPYGHDFVCCWVNRGDKPCVTAFVLVDAKPVSVGGRTINAVA